jgi:hypothetical protein
MLDKNTFGKTPAAIYLADRLNLINDPKYSRKLSKMIHNIQATIADAVQAAETGALSIKTLHFISRHLRLDIEDAADNLKQEMLYVGSGGHEMPDLLSINLFENVLKGELKSVFRRASEVRFLKDKQDRVVNKILRDNPEASDTLVIKPITIADVKDPTTPESLIKRSREKLKRNGRVNTLYGEQS